MRVPLAIIKCGLIVSLFGCSGGPQEIHYGSDQCDNCRMSIVDKRFGSELVTRQGRAYKFDSIECLVVFRTRGVVNSEDYGSEWVSCVDDPGVLHNVSDVSFVISDSLRSPMGANVNAFVNESGLQEASALPDAITARWDELENHLRQTGYIR